MPRKSLKTITDDIVKLAGDDDLIPERKQVTPTVLVDGYEVERKSIKRDPLQLKVRLYTQIGELLHQLEGATDEPITVRERIAALVAIGRLQDLLIEKGKDEDEHAGSAIRKYAGAFKNDTGGRKKVARSSARDNALESNRDWGDESGLDTDAI